MLILPGVFLTISLPLRWQMVFFPSLVSDVAEVQSDVHPFSPKCHALLCSSFTSCNKLIEEGGDKRLLPFVSYT